MNDDATSIVADVSRPEMWTWKYWRDWFIESILGDLIWLAIIGSCFLWYMLLDAVSLVGH